MNPKLISILQKVFWFIGWAILLMAVVTIGFQAYEFFRSPLSEFGDVMPKKEFYFLSSLRMLFSSIAQAFFAFLISAVFDMVFHRAPIRSQRADRYLILCCLGFVGEALTGLISWTQSLFWIIPQMEFTTELGILSLSTYILNVFSLLIPLVYAITIYVLFRHFTKMISFEAEVI